MPSGCFICKDIFDTAVGIVTTKCGHLFHNLCIDRWLARSYTCPECRGNVTPNNLTKLFFHDVSNINFERSLDTLKNEMHAKDLKVITKDQKIEKLKNECTTLKRGISRSVQAHVALQNSFSPLESQVQNLSFVDSEYQILMNVINNLENEYRQLSLIKTVANACFIDAQNILTEMQVNVSSEDAKLATHKIATYCSLIKQQIVHSNDMSTLLKKEITQLKCKMEMLHEDGKKEIRQQKQGFNSLELNSSSQSGFYGPIPTFGVSNNHSLPSSNLAGLTSAYCPSGENQVTPTASDLPKKKRAKIRKVDGSEKASTQILETHVLRLATSALQVRGDSRNEVCVSQVTYRLRDRLQIVKPKRYM